MATSYDFYSSLTNDEQSQYDFMLETNYVLLRCDEWSFIESDENGHETRSVSWIHTIQPTLDLFRANPDSYPRGSLSANRHYYEVIRNYWHGQFPSTDEFNYLRQGLRNFLVLRRDDSGSSLSYLFGSYFDVLTQLGGRDSRPYRSVEINLRHSAAALWILCEESAGRLARPLQDSLASFFYRSERYLAKNEDWDKDSFKHMTLASIMKTTESVMHRFPKSILTKRASDTRLTCREAILSQECMAQDIFGSYYWRLPDANKVGVANYEFYLSGFALSQVPEILEDRRAQSVIKTMIDSQVITSYGSGVPIHRLGMSSTSQEELPDFGATAACLFPLLYCLENSVGDADWLKYCDESYKRLLKLCLDIYDKKQAYLLPYSENNTKILLLPRFNTDALREERVNKYIRDLKTKIAKEMVGHRGNLARELGKVDAPSGLEAVKEIITTWNITKYWKQQKRWKIKPTLIGEKWSDVGQFVGGLIVGALQALNK